jgi:hypothetical protein
MDEDDIKTAALVSELDHRIRELELNAAHSTLKRKRDRDTHRRLLQQRLQQLDIEMKAQTTHTRRLLSRIDIVLSVNSSETHTTNKTIELERQKQAFKSNGKSEGSSPMNQQQQLYPVQCTLSFKQIF